MASVVALIPDLLFGSRVHADLSAGGHTVELVKDAKALREALKALREALISTTILVVDLTDEVHVRVETVQSFANDGLLSDVRTLAFYSHVDADARDQANRAGFDLVVPRSRMAREGGALVSGLLGA